jgi:hypothetical protein
LANASLRSSPSDHPFREASSPDDGVSHFPKRKFAMSQLTNLAFFRARPGQPQALGAALSALVAPTRAETAGQDLDLHATTETSC